MPTAKISKLLLIGATGDLAGRFLLPALVRLHQAGRLSSGFSVVGVGGKDWGDDELRRFAAERVDQHAGDAPAADRDAVVRSLSYMRADACDPGHLDRAVRRSWAGESANEPLVAYLALPTGVVPGTLRALGGVELPRGSRIAVEKPFGEDLASAVELNELLADAVGEGGEEAAFRVDHALGMKPVEDLLELRTANRVIDALWNGAQIDEVEILWEETLALEGRARFYDGAGALRDALANHMMQVFSLVAMEPPAGPGERELRDRKVAALRDVRPLEASEAARRSRRARYTAGRLVGAGGASARPVPDYAREDGVDPGRKTETFAEVVLEVPNQRWRGTRFRLRTGKALARRWKGVIVRFRPTDGDRRARANELRLGVDGPHEIALHLFSGAGDSERDRERLVLSAGLTPPPLPPYGRVLLEILEGRSSLSARDDEVENAWRILSPVMDAWSEDRVPLDEYAAGSAGPPPLPLDGSR